MLALFLFGLWGGTAGVIVPAPLVLQLSGEAMATPQMTGEAVTFPQLSDQQVID